MTPVNRIVSPALSLLRAAAEARSRLHDPASAGARILLVGEDFDDSDAAGAVPPLIAALGFRVVIGSTCGPSFVDDCFRRGLLVLTLPEPQVRELDTLAGRGDFVIDLQQQRITCPDGQRRSFFMSPLRRRMFLEGRDEVALCRDFDRQVGDFQYTDGHERPWVYVAEPPLT